MKEQRNRCWASALVLALAAGLAALCFLRLSRPDGAQRDSYLGCTEEDSGGWTFFTEEGLAEPVFGFGGYLDGIPAEGTGPVAAERALGEAGQRRFLQFSCYGTGLQVFLDGKLLYTDFPEEENRADTFLEGVDPEGIQYDGLRLPLPSDCAGKRLRVVTYGPSVDGLRQAVFPTQVSRFSDAVIQTTGTVWPVAAMTARVILGLFLLLVFVLAAWEEDFLWKLLPLSGYFLLAAMAGACGTYLESAAGLEADSGWLNWVYRVHMDLLYVYLALELGGRRGQGLLWAALAHALLCALERFGILPGVPAAMLDWMGFTILLAALVLLTLSKERRKMGLLLWSLLGTLGAVWGVSRFVGTGVLYPLTNPVTAFLGGYPHALYALLCGFIGILSAVQVVVEFVRRLLRRQRRIQAMEHSARVAQEKFEQTQASLRQTAAFRHEWKNHVAALEVLARKEDMGELRDYLSRLNGELEQLSPKIYTANLTVNTILQRFAAQAKKAGVAFRVKAILPEALPIPDEDLCAFLFNLLENALEAAEQTEEGDIFCSMQVRQQYLAIHCENTYSGALRTTPGGQLLTTKEDPASHGFGVMKMIAIAKKYGSVLDISYDESRFTVMTALKL